MQLMCMRHWRRDANGVPTPDRLTLQIKANTGEREELIRLNLMAKPFLRDLVKDRLVRFWEMLDEFGVTLAMREGERFEDLEALAQMELRFMRDEIAIEGRRLNADCPARAWS